MDLDRRFRTLPEAVDGLTELESEFLQARDRRCIFLTIYVRMSREMERLLCAQRFLDNDWVERYTILFADYYRVALRAWQRRESPPKAWRAAFETAAGGKALVLQDALLGINAHINHDLAFTLRDLGLNPNREQKLTDHESVNDVLASIAGEVQKLVAEKYAPGLTAAGALAGNLDELAADFSMRKAREAAWEGAVALTGARTGWERLLVSGSIEARAAVLARLLLVPNLNRTLLARLRQIESGAWWDWMAAAPKRIRAKKLAG